jgi:uncharacterized protein (DUF302 family)
MEETRYGLRVDLNMPYEDALERITAALKQEGFDVILGACNPPLADRALHAELEIGLLLPCNVIVYEREPGTSAVAAMAPLPAMGMVGNKELEAVAREADTRLRRALERLEGA